ncbi:amidase [Colwellia sp. RSH04]|uniref:amidase n=1 Tax=Colwellia sp. RSH04 TaxID=2305464 RepID=UPI000E587010|nr:amidase [Colwellia sp. RSH04]RHW76497.1 amidase [Colwellia sp. RSH04]
MTIHYLSATELLTQFNNKKLSPVDVVHAYQQRFLEINDHVNAFSFTFFERTLEQAMIAEQAYIENTAKTLTGLAIAIKDETYVTGEPMTNGSLCLKDYIATSTDPVPEALLNDGAIILGRTTTPEFSTSSVTWSKLWGISRNPWNLSITCGGSSGGSAIAVASGMCSFANGTDIGGSLRIPAAMCGIYGYKPPHGRVAEISPYNIDPYCHHGLLTRNLNDMLLAYPRIRGANWRDSHSFIPDINPSLKSTKSIKQLKVAISIDLGFYEVDNDIKDNLITTAKVLEQSGAIVEYVDINWDEQVIQTAKVHQHALMGQILKREYLSSEKFNDLTPYVQQYLKNVATTTLDDVFDANIHACKMWDELAPVFKEYDVLICPTVATSNIPANFDYSKDPVFINKKQVDANKGWFMTYPFNTLGQCPVLAMPNGFCNNSVPSSIQIVGRPYEEEHIFTVARVVEEQQVSDLYTTRFPEFT